MNNAASPQTDRELLLTVVSRLDNVSESMGRIAKTLENLETNKLAEHDRRISSLEKWRSEANGMWKMIVAIGIVSLIALFKAIFA